MPHSKDYLSIIELDEALRLILMDVYTADQYSIEKRDTILTTANNQIKKLMRHLVDEQYKLAISEEKLDEQHKHGAKWFLYNLASKIKPV